MKLSNKKQEALSFISHYVAANQRAPTISEIGKHLRFRSSSTIHEILVELEKEGLIKRTPNISRGIEIVQQPMNAS